MSAPGYDACLEVGRARNPPSEILEALARVLVLDAAEREHPNDLCAHAGSVPDRPEQPQRYDPGRSTHSKGLATCRRSFSAAKPVACAVLTGIGRLPAAKCTLACGLSVYRS